MAVPLPTLLSRALIAHTIEFDNEVEHRLPHTTARGPAAHSGRGPWLVSRAMWSNFLRFVPPGGVPLAAVRDLAGLTNLGGLTRWRYVTVEDGTVALTPGGERAAKVFRPLASEIDRRWADRLPGVPELRAALAAVADPGLPWSLPVADQAPLAAPPARRHGPGEDVGALLGQVLVAVTLDAERDAPVSMAVGANVLRVLTPEGVRHRDLPLRTGLAREATRLSVNHLVQRELATLDADRVVRLTAAGGTARRAYDRRVAATERADLRADLRAALETVLAGDLAAGLRPYPDGWRAHPPYRTQTQAVLADPTALPHHPAVSHRGGYPDGA